jgi:excisionase family DNA binding protein
MAPLLSVDDLARILNASRRTIERLRSAGKLPKPDLLIGKMPRWRHETVRDWIEGGGR